MYEAIGLKNLLLDKCLSTRAREEMAATYDKFLAHAIKDHQFALSPGNIRGGLTTIEEKSMGAVIKIGSCPISGVLKLGQKPPYAGAWYVDMISDDETGCGFPISEDASSNLLYAASGAHLCLLTSGRGHVVNNPIIPTLKLTGNSETFQRLSEDTDFDASPLLSGVSLQDVTEALLELITGILNGQKTRGEVLGHAEAVLNFENQQAYVLGT